MKEIEIGDENTRALVSIIHNMKWYLANYASGLINTPEKYMTDELRGRQKADIISQVPYSL